MAAVALTVVAVALAAVAGGCTNGADRQILQSGKEYRNASPSKQQFLLPDSSLVILAPDAKIEVGKGFERGYKELSLDGEAWFDIKGPVTLHTRDMVVDILSAGKFRAEAFRGRPGEQFDLLLGSARVKKCYHSDMDSAAELLGPGDMVMINRDIDLMEKEHMTMAELNKLKSGW